MTLVGSIAPLGPGEQQDCLGCGAAGRIGRAARVMVFTVISVLLAVGAHRLAGGAAPGDVAVAAAGALLALLGWVLSRRERSGRQLGVLVIGTQLAMHVWFVAPALLAVSRARGGGRGSSTSSLLALFFCHHGATPITTAQVTAATRGLDVGSLHAAVGAAGAPAARIGLGNVIGSMVGMVLAHLVAAGVVAWWLRLGERKAWAALRRVIRVLQPMARRAAPVQSCLSLPLRLSVLVSQRWAGALSGRGPPATPVVLLTS